MSEEKVIHILIADDHPIVRQGLIGMIECEPDMRVIAEASNGLEAIDLFRQHQPDITLIDLRMPKLDGVEAIATIRKEFPQARILVLTTYDTDEDIYRGLRAGAQGYLLKDVPCDELLEAIRAIDAGQKRIPPGITAKLVERLNKPELTEREQEVLHLIATGKSNQDIGISLSISEATVKYHVNHILHKLNVNDRTQAVTYALKRGLVHLE
ncbi:MAG: response regulator transcription factor [Ktedonobacteraceae bacterium]|nr:response regulator transcription factor [Ktedonobacteraceae bacterium]